MHETERLAAVLADLRGDDLSPHATLIAREAITRVAAAAEHSRESSDDQPPAIASRVAAPGRSSVLGTPGALMPPWAAFSNAVAAAAADPEESAVVSVALACIQHVRGDAGTFRTAVFAGREAAHRLRSACAVSVTQFDLTAICGAVGGAVAGGRALGLDPTRMRHALGVVGSMCGGTIQHLHDRASSAGVIQQYGWPAQSGCTAALLAAAGLTGPATVLEGENGICRSFSTGFEPDIERLVEGLAEGLFLNEQNEGDRSDDNWSPAPFPYRALLLEATGRGDEL